MGPIGIPVKSCQKTRFYGTVLAVQRLVTQHKTKQTLAFHSYLTLFLYEKCSSVQNWYDKIPIVTVDKEQI